MHPYAYASNNPLTNIDADGNFSLRAAQANVGAALSAFAAGSARAIVRNLTFIQSVTKPAPFKMADDIRTGIQSTEALLNVGSDVASDPKGTLGKVGEGIKGAYEDFAAAPGTEQAKVIGDVTTELLVGAALTKGAGLAEGTGLKIVNNGTKRAAQAQIGNLNISLENYTRSGGFGLNFRDTSLPGAWYDQRVLGLDAHPFRLGSLGRVNLPHINIDAAPFKGLHLPWDAYKLFKK